MLAVLVKNRYIVLFYVWLIFNIDCMTFFADCSVKMGNLQLFNFLKFLIKIQSCGKTWVNLDIGSGFQLTNTILRP